MEPAKKNTFRILCQCECLSGSQSCCKRVNRVFPQNEQQVKESSAAGSQGNHSCQPENNILQASKENGQNPRAPELSVTGYDPPITPIPRPSPARDPAPMDPSRSGTALPVGASPSAEGLRCPGCDRDVGSSRLVEEKPQDGLDESVPSVAESPSPGTVPSSSPGRKEVGKPGTSREKDGQQQSVDFSFRSMWEKLQDSPWPSLHSHVVQSGLQGSRGLSRYGVKNIPPRSESHVQAPYLPEEATPASSIPDSELLRVPRTDYEFWAAFNFGGIEAARMLLMERRERAATAKKASIS